MALIEPTPGNPHGTVDAQKVTPEGTTDDETALQIVNQDAEMTEAWMNIRLWNLRWLEADIMYQSPPSVAVWEGTNIPMANVSKFTVATHTNSLLGQALAGLFYEDPPFEIRPKARTTQDTVRAIKSVQSTQLVWMGFREEVKYGFFSAMLFGTAIWKWGWKEQTKMEKKFVRKAQPIELKQPTPGHTISFNTPESDDFEVQEFEHTEAYPWLECLDIRHVYVDPSLRTPDIRSAKFVIHRLDMNYHDLMELKNDPFSKYDLPTEDEVKEWFTTPVDAPSGAPTVAESYSVNTTYVHHAMGRFYKSSADPLFQPMEVLEHVTKDRIITVLNRKRVIRNEKNPFGKINYFSINWWSHGDAFWGLGLGRVLGGEQRVQQGLTNGMLDISSLVLHPTYLRARGANVPTQQIRQRIGGIIDVDVDPLKGVKSIKDAFTLLEQPRIPMEIFQEIGASESRSESSSGANDQTTIGASSGKQGIGRSAAGAHAIMAAAANRLGSFVEDFNTYVYQPWLWQMHDLNTERLPASVMRRMLSDELGPSFKQDMSDYLNAGIVEFDILAGSHLIAKQQMAQALTLIIQFFENPQILQQLNDQGYYVDAKEILNMMHDMSGWKNFYDVVKKMTPEMIQQKQANNPAIIKANADAAKTKQQTDAKAQLTDTDNQARAVREMFRQAMLKPMESEGVEGEPGTKAGFGTQETA